MRTTINMTTNKMPVISATPGDLKPNLKKNDMA